MREKTKLGRPRNDPVVLIMENIELHDSGCWLWTGQRTRDGYAVQVRSPYGRINAHRVSYATFVGPLDVSLQIDHVKARGCTHRHCVNPAHLEQVPWEENAKRARKTHCVLGHLLLETTEPGHRRCQECPAERVRNYDANNRIKRRDAMRRRRALAREAGRPTVSPGSVEAANGS